MSIDRHLDVNATRTGAVRLSANLQPEEMKHGAYVRDVDSLTARRLAIELLQAAEEADRIIADR
ncbi:hypothetical protein ACFWCA_19255 [Streptomyces phaeochromogenes]|uniref:hypothetical protein n=1 Tax=Streptomyces phaeochromogenes TaxID=1923 RepID=UPI00369B1E89